MIPHIIGMHGCLDVKGAGLGQLLSTRLLPLRGGGGHIQRAAQLQRGLLLVTVTLSLSRITVCE